MSLLNRLFGRDGEEDGEKPWSPCMVALECSHEQETTQTVEVGGEQRAERLCAECGTHLGWGATDE